jgi:hypothetical protein
VRWRDVVYACLVDVVVVEEETVGGWVGGSVSVCVRAWYMCVKGVRGQ